MVSAVAFGTCFSSLYPAAHWESSGDDRLLTLCTLPAAEKPHDPDKMPMLASFCLMSPHCIWDLGCCGLLASDPVSLIDSPQLWFGNFLWPLLSLLLRSARHRWISLFTGNSGKRWGDTEGAPYSCCQVVLFLSRALSPSGWRGLVICNNFFWLHKLTSWHADSAIEPLCSAKLLRREETIIQRCILQILQERAGVLLRTVI